MVLNHGGPVFWANKCFEPPCGNATANSYYNNYYYYYDRLQKMQKGELIGDILKLLFRDPNGFQSCVIILNIYSTSHMKARSRHGFSDG